MRKQPWERAFFCLADAIASVEHETGSKSIPYRAMARTTGHAVIFREKNPTPCLWSLSRSVVLKQPWERAFFCLADAITSVEHETGNKSIPHRVMARTTGA